LQAKVAPNSNGGPSSILTDRIYGARIRRITPIQEGVTAPCNRLFSTEGQTEKKLRKRVAVTERQEQKEKEKQERKEKREKERWEKREQKENEKQEKKEKRERAREEKKKLKEEEKEREREEKRKKKEKEREEKKERKEKEKQEEKLEKMKERQKDKRLALIQDSWAPAKRKTRLEAFIDINDYKETIHNVGKPLRKSRFLQKLLNRVLNRPFLLPIVRKRRTRVWAYERKDGKPVNRKPRRPKTLQEWKEYHRQQGALRKLASAGAFPFTNRRRWSLTYSTLLKDVKRHVKVAERKSIVRLGLRHWKRLGALLEDRGFIDASDKYHIRIFQLTGGSFKETAEITESPVLRNGIEYFGYDQTVDDQKLLAFTPRTRTFCRKTLVVTTRRDWPYVYLPIRLGKFEQYEQLIFFYDDEAQEKNFRTINAFAARLIERIRYKIYLAPVPYVSAIDREAGTATLECDPAFRTLSAEGLLLIEDPGFASRFYPPDSKRVLVFGDEGQEVPQWLVSKDWYAYYALGLVRAVFPEDLFVSYEDKVLFEGVIAKSELDLIIMYENVWYWDTLEKVGGPIPPEEEYLVLRDAMYINTESDEKLLDSYHDPETYTITPPFTVEGNELEQEVENFAAEANFNYGHDEYTFGHLDDILDEIEAYRNDRKSTEVAERDVYQPDQKLGWTTIEPGHISTSIFSKEAFRKRKIAEWKEEDRIRRIKDAEKPPTKKEPRYSLRKAFVPYTRW